MKFREFLAMSPAGACARCLCMFVCSFVCLGLGCRVLGSGFRVQDLGYVVFLIQSWVIVP